MPQEFYGSQGCHGRDHSLIPGISKVCAACCTSQSSECCAHSIAGHNGQLDGGCLCVACCQPGHSLDTAGLFCFGRSGKAHGIHKGDHRNGESIAGAHKPCQLCRVLRIQRILGLIGCGNAHRGASKGCQGSVCRFTVVPIQLQQGICVCHSLYQIRQAGGCLAFAFSILKHGCSSQVVDGHQVHQCSCLLHGSDVILAHQCADTSLGSGLCSSCMLCKGRCYKQFCVLGHHHKIGAACQQCSASCTGAGYHCDLGYHAGQLGRSLQHSAISGQGIHCTVDKGAVGIVNTHNGGTGLGSQSVQLCDLCCMLQAYRTVVYGFILGKCIDCVSVYIAVGTNDSCRIFCFLDSCIDLGKCTIIKQSGKACICPALHVFFHVRIFLPHM